MRDIALNAQYLILFEKVRDTGQIGTLAREMGLPHLIDAYKKATSETYQPLIVDLGPETKDCLRLRSHISPSQFTRIYVKKNLPIPCLKE